MWSKEYGDKFHGCKNICKKDVISLEAKAYTQCVIDCF